MTILLTQKVRSQSFTLPVVDCPSAGFPIGPLPWGFGVKIQCGAQWFLGPFGSPNTDQPSKTYVGLLPHLGFTFQSNMAIIDSWDGMSDPVTINFDAGASGTEICAWNMGGVSNLCGTGWNDYIDTYSYTNVLHGATTLTVTFTSGFDEPLINESLGIADMTLILLNICQPAIPPVPPEFLDDPINPTGCYPCVAPTSAPNFLNRVCYLCMNLPFPVNTCRYCTSITVCSKCISLADSDPTDYFLAKDNLSCLLSCLIPSQIDTWTRMAAPKQCVLCDLQPLMANCYTCLFGGIICTQCKLTFYLWANQTSCQPDCTADSGTWPNNLTPGNFKCTLCSTTFINCHTCTPLVCLTCLNPYFLHTGGLTCVLNCTTQDTNAYENLILRQCILCSTSISGCQTCLADGSKCTLCTAPAAISSDSINCDIPDCSIETPGVWTDWTPPKKCVLCSVSMPNCSSCTSVNFCLRCANNTYLQTSNGKCLNSCLAGQFGNTEADIGGVPSGNKCRIDMCLVPPKYPDVNNICGLCDASCLAYKCLANNDPKQCTNCPIGAYLSRVVTSDLFGSCVTVISNCNAPQKVFVPQALNPIKNVSECLPKCPPACFVTNLTSICVLCPPSCLACVSINLCTKCNDQSGLDNPPNACILCPKDTYSDSSVCKPCPRNFDTNGLKGQKSCLPCLKKYTSDPGKDCLLCGDGSFITSQGFCIACDHSCLSCNGPLVNNCVTCPVGFMLTPDFTCKEGCEVGQWANLVVFKCLLCNIACKSCTASTSYDCILCAKNYGFSGQQCVNPCPATPTLQYLNDATGKCEECDASCQFTPENCAYECQVLLFKGVMTAIDNPQIFRIVFNHNWDELLSNTQTYFSLILPKQYTLGINYTYTMAQLPAITNVIEIRIAWGLYTRTTPFDLLSIQINTDLVNTQLGENENRLTLIKQYSEYHINLEQYIECSQSEFFNKQTLKCDPNGNNLVKGVLRRTLDPQKLFIQFSTRVSLLAMQRYVNGLSVTIGEIDPERYSVSCDPDLTEYNNFITVSYVSPTMSSFGQTSSRILQQLQEDSSSDNNGQLQLQVPPEDFDAHVNRLYLNFDFKQQAVTGQVSVVTQLQLDPIMNTRTSFRFALPNLQTNMLDYYPLSLNELKSINNTAQNAQTANLATSFLGLTSALGSAGSQVTASLLMLLGLVNIIKYIDINYPPNIRQMFIDNQGSPNMIYKYKFTDIDQNDQMLMKRNYEVYQMSPYFLDNFGDNICQFIFAYIVGLAIIAFYQLYQSRANQKSNQNQKQKWYINIFNKIVQFLKHTFVWSFFSVLLMSNYKDYCMYTFANIMYAPINSTTGLLNFLFGAINTVVVLIFLFHVWLVIRHAIKAEILSNQEKQILKINLMLHQQSKNCNKVDELGKNTKNIVEIKQGAIFDSSNPFHLNQNSNTQSQTHLASQNALTQKLTNGPKAIQLRKLQRNQTQDKQQSQSTLYDNQIQTEIKLVKNLDDKDKSIANEVQVKQIPKKNIPIINRLVEYYNPPFKSKESLTLLERHAVFFRDFKSTHVIQKYWALIGLFRYFLLCFTVVFVYRQPLIQITLCCTFNFIFLLFIIVYRPYAKTQELLIQCTGEILILGPYFCTLGLAVYDYQSNYANVQQRMNIGAAMSYFEIAIIGIVMLNFLYMVGKLLYLAFSKVCFNGLKRKKNNQISPMKKIAKNKQIIHQVLPRSQYHYQTIQDQKKEIQKYNVSDIAQEENYFIPEGYKDLPKIQQINFQPVSFYTKNNN